MCGCARGRARRESVQWEGLGDRDEGNKTPALGEEGTPSQGGGPAAA